ncbi:MAG: 50S ribosomal protein L9 [Deltaproteobacteria bacterium]|nr:50S ribosomal protein L9 [Deltaproteobacteria bacterium]
MKVILREDVPNLGMVGDLVRVRDGYGRNYLIPQGRAVLASARSVHELEHQKRLAAHHRSKATAVAAGDKARIEGLSVVMSAKVAVALGEQAKEDQLQKLFGTITSRDLEKVLAGAGVKVDHRRITLSEPVRTVGKFLAKVRLDGGVVAQLPFWVLTEGATDVDAEKKRVEAAQEAARKHAAEIAARERAKAAESAKAAAKAEKVETPEGAAEGETAAVEAQADKAEKAEKPAKKAKAKSEAEGEGEAAEKAEKPAKAKKAKKTEE